MKRMLVAITILLVVLAARRVSATELLFNWQSAVGGGVYDGFVKEKASAIGSNFSPSGVDSFSFGSPSGTYTAANSFLNTGFGGVNFSVQGGILVPFGSGGFDVRTPDHSQELLVFPSALAQETVPGQSGVVNGTWTVTNLDTTIPDRASSALLLATALGALGLFHAFGRRCLSQA